MKRVGAKQAKGSKALGNYQSLAISSSRFPSPSSEALFNLIFPVSAQLKSFSEDFYDAGGPSFIGDIQNVTVKAGRDAVLNCVVKNLGEYKVSSS